MGGGWRSLAPSAGAAFATSLLLAFYLTPIFRDSARRFGIVDRPDGGLKTQKEPVPYLGGLAVFSSVLFPVSIFLRFSDELMGLLLASTIVVMLGLIDDIGRLSPRIKLVVQVVAVFLMIKSGIRIRVGFLSPLLCVALTFLWMLLMTNGFNLIDVMDGLAGGWGPYPRPRSPSCSSCRETRWGSSFACRSRAPFWGSSTTTALPPRSSSATPGLSSSGSSWEGWPSGDSTRTATPWDGSPRSPYSDRKSVV